MGIISEIKSTYTFAKKEVSRDLKNNKTTNNVIKIGRKRINQIKSLKLKKPNFKVKKGKKLSNRATLKRIKKKVGLSINLKKRKFKRKNIKQIRDDSFGIYLNI